MHRLPLPASAGSVDERFAVVNGVVSLQSAVAAAAAAPADDAGAPLSKKAQKRLAKQARNQAKKAEKKGQKQHGKAARGGGGAAKGEAAGKKKAAQPAAARAPAAKAAPASNGGLEDVDAIKSAVLACLAADGSIADTLPWAAERGFGHGAVDSACRSLTTDDCVVLANISHQSRVLTPLGESWCAEGTPELRVARVVAGAGEAGVAMGDLAGLVADHMTGKEASAAQGKAMQRKWLRLDKATKTLHAVAGPEQLADLGVDPVVLALRGVASDGALPGDKKIAKELGTRKLIANVNQTSFKVTKGAGFTTEQRKVVADLTVDMLRSGEWEGASFRPINLNAEGVPPTVGALHPLLKVRAEFRRVLMELGFQEMPTNRFVESSFWNFDALFQPQSHPARDAHDTFFVKDPAQALTVDESYLERVREMHEKGGFGSLGYGCEWSREESLKNIMRTHTTAVSSRVLYALAHQKGGFKPIRCFSIDRVFRNEALDATHLAEFHQVEGVVADYNLSLGDLIGIIQEFFRRIGITELRFKPAYNPYTEPSMEIFGFHPDLGKDGAWTEIGNSGIFRPEMLAPMGLPPNVRVIAWGLSLERPTMIKYGLRNIRDLFGSKVQLSDTRRGGIVRFPNEPTGGMAAAAPEAAAAAAGQA